jgi:hypothetical protein
MDSKNNMENPFTPGLVSLSEQLLYKVSSLDSAVQQGFRRLDERMDRFQADLHENQITTNDKINQLDKEFHEAIAFKRARIDALVANRDSYRQEQEKRLQVLETWQAVAMAKISVIMGVITTVAILIAPTIRHILGLPS